MTARRTIQIRRSVCAGLLLAVCAVSAAGRALTGDAPPDRPGLAPFSAAVEKGIEKWGFLTVRGEIAAEPQYDYADDFVHAERARVGVEGFVSFAGPDGRPAMTERFADAEPFSPGGLASVLVGSGYGAVSPDGTLVIPAEYDLPLFFDAAGMSRAVRGGRHGFIDTENRERIPLRYEDSRPFGDGDLAAVRLDGSWGFVDRDGNTAVPHRYENAGEFRFGLCMVQKQGLQGFLDAEGREAVPCRFAAVLPFAANGFAPAADAESGRFGFIDRNGEFMIPPRFEAAKPFAECGLAPVQLDGKWGAVNAAGEIIVRPEYTWAEAENGLVTVRQGWEQGVIDGDGKCWDQHRHFRNGLTLRMQEGKGGYTDAEGQTVLEAEIVKGMTVIRSSDGTLLYPEQEVLDQEYRLPPL